MFFLSENPGGPARPLSKQQVASQGEGVNAGSLKTFFEGQQRQKTTLLLVSTLYFFFWGGEVSDIFFSKGPESPIINVIN